MTLLSMNFLVFSQDLRGIFYVMYQIVCHWRVNDVLDGISRGLIPVMFSVITIGGYAVRC